MNPNLLSLSLDALGGDFANLSGPLLRESQNAMRSAIDLLLPVVVGSLAKKGATSEGVADLASLVCDTKLDTSLIESIEDVLAGSTSRLNTLLKVGTSRLVPWLFGDASASLVNAISATSEIRRSSATTLVALIVPIVLTVVTKQIRDKGLAATSLSSLLRSQRACVRYKLDSRIIGALGFARAAEFLDLRSGQPETGTTGADAAVRSPTGTAGIPAPAAAVTVVKRLACWLRSRSPGSARLA